MFGADASAAAVTFQVLGTLLVGSMTAQIARILSWRYAKEWAMAWGAMFLALASIRIYIATLQPLWWLPYLIGQWLFLVLLYSGCRELATGRVVDLRSGVYAMPAALLTAVLMVSLSETFDHLFAIQAGFLAVGFASAFVQLGAFAAERRAAGWRTMRIALALLTLQYLIYVPLYAVHGRGLTLPLLAYSSLADFLGGVLLAFSMSLIVYEESHRESEDRVTALQLVRDQLEQKSRVDPLTLALNRHALHVMRGGTNGAVVMIDIDCLKQINDRDGHVVGDLVIRATATAVRGRVRPDDLLFRWGGDEFLLVMPNATMITVSDRLAPLADGVTVGVPGVGNGLRFNISWGGAEFGHGASFDDALRLADEQMYARRREVRGSVAH